ncbi:transcription initiation factor IIF subunit beta-like [Zingiber officinale]|uniref:transcription initiation factor IIF subunit beta-like n=1 Tax=Zingiber officinale TaxID=94328 RepID=UPI001C4D3309|nr:transcription initiation factor IIF subunit beta-like [Zingiber officinale]
MEDDRIFLDTTRAELPVWLLKCPPAISRVFQLVTSNSFSTTSPVIAKIVHTVDLLHLDDPSSEQFTLEMIQTNPNTPRSYKLNMSKDVAPMCVFSKSNQGKISVEGKVECKFDMEPQNLRAYSNLCRDRTNKAAVKTRKVQVLENDHGMFMRPMPGIVVGQLPSSLKEKRKLAQSKRQDAKRVRMDKGEMLNVLFRLFERQPNWGLKQLVLETNQPQQFLKEILSEICVYNKRGPNQATHELKAEYKNLGGSNNE